MNSAIEIINAIMTPANKLIDAVTGAIGKIYEPTHIKRMANAKAYEIEKVGRALCENADIPIEYSKGEICADTTDFDDLVKRTQSRLAFQEIFKQQNIESVTKKAYQILEGETECSQDPVDHDWMNRFFNSVEDISNEDIQQLWARILAGEVKHPKTFSLRTLEALRNITQAEAKLFENVCKVVVCTNEECFIPKNDNILKKHRIAFEDLLLLSECGFVSSQVLLSVYDIIPPDTKNQSVFYCKNKVIKATNSNFETEEISVSAYPLSRIGIELFKIFDSGIEDEDIEDLMKSILFDKSKIKISLGQREK